MKIDQRALWTKSLLYRNFGISNSISKKAIEDAISKTGLKKTSARSRGKIVEYLWNKKHLKEEKDGKTYLNIRGKGLHLLSNFPNVETNTTSINTDTVAILKQIGNLKQILEDMERNVKEMPDIITSAIDVLDKIRDAGKVKVKFKKADNSDRTMVCTLDFGKIPKSDRPKSVNLPAILKLIRDKKILHVYDLEKAGWRSIPIERLEWLHRDGVTYRIQLPKKG